MAVIVYSTVDKNQFFSTPVSIIRKRAQLPPPLTGQPGPFSLGEKGVLDSTFKRAGFINVNSNVVNAPVKMSGIKLQSYIFLIIFLLMIKKGMTSIGYMKKKSMQKLKINKIDHNQSFC